VAGEKAATATTSYVAAVAENKTPDTETMGFSLSYNIDALTITAYNKGMTTTGTTDKNTLGLAFPMIWVAWLQKPVLRMLMAKA
jgi:hypothetical protein